MFVGSLRVRLRLRDARSLKDKRQVVRGILDRLRHDFRVAAAEVDALDKWQLAVLGVAQVGNQAQHVRACLDQIAAALRRHPIAEFIDQEIDVREHQS